MKARLVPPALLAALVAVLALAGCGGSGSSSGGGEAVAVAPPGAPLFMRFVVRPEGETKANLEALAKQVAGIEDLGGLIVSELEKSAAEEGEPFDYEKEVEPWLGEEGGLFAEEYKGGDFEGYGVALQTEDEDAAWKFVEKQTAAEDEPAKSGSYEGVDFKVTADKGQAVGVFDGLLVYADDEAVFKDMVDASAGESLADQERYAKATSSLPDRSAADLFLDAGAMIRESGEGVDPQAKSFFEGAGIELDEATLLASVIPGSENLEIDLSTNATEASSPAGDGAKMLAALPGTSVAAFASPEFGTRLQKAIDRLDQQGIPGQLPPHQLKQGLRQSGFDLDRFAGSIGDVGLFLTGSSERSLGGAVVLEAHDPTEAANTVSNLGLLLRASQTPGVTALNGKFRGFSIRSAELGPQPLVVATGGSRLVIGYGLRAATAALTESGQTLGENPTFEEAGEALGSTPLSGFVDGQAALRLVSALVPPGEEGFRKAKRYLNGVRYVAIGSEASGGHSTAKLIVGVGK
ncbi:MAG TPA: DUF3352 domain-containing protein [Solirubrobacterales bacterium]|nr:DUF3352 domain-containing protein [Solirubrobacterales bacterium]